MKETKPEYLWWVQEMSYGQTNTHWLVGDLLESMATLQDVDDHLSNNMREMMDTKGWDFIINYDVVAIDMEGIKESDIPKTKTEKKPSLKPKVKKPRQVKSTIVPVIAPVPLPDDVEPVEYIIDHEPIDYIKISKQSRPQNDNYYGADLNYEGSEEVTKNLLKIIKGKKVLLLENSCVFSDQAGDFYQWSLKNKVDSYSLFNIRSLPLEFVISKILEYDVIAFQSQYVYQSTHQLVDFVTELKIPKTIIEIAGRNRWWSSPAKQHKIYRLNFVGDEVSEWDLNELE